MIASKSDGESAAFLCHLQGMQEFPGRTREAIGERIRYLCEDVLDMTQEEFAKPLGVTRGAVGNWVLGKGIKRENLALICEVYPVASYEWLTTGKGRKPVPVGPRDKLISAVDGRVKVSGVPRDGIPEIDVTAGLGGGGLTLVKQQKHGEHTIAAEEVRDYWRLPQWLLNSWANADPNHVVCFPAQGDSMSPTIENGDVIFADLRHTAPSPPGIYVLADQFGGIIAKRLEVVSGLGDEVVRVKISSDNPRHETTERSLEEIRIIGRYLGRLTTS